jgi:hypothetical protein
VLETLSTAQNGLQREAKWHKSPLNSKFDQPGSAWRAASVLFKGAFSSPRC